MFKDFTPQMTGFVSFTLTKLFMISGKIRQLDQAVMRLVANSRNPILKDLSSAISALCSPINVLVYLSLTAVVNTGLLQSFLTYIGVTWLVVYSIKFLVSRERPEGNLEAGLTASFPSAHSATAFVLAGLLSQIFQNASPLLYMLAVLVAFSRIYLQTHYLSDVTFGSLIGIIVFLLL
jgi:membrane-associated phospholipid phosphatase